MNITNIDNLSHYILKLIISHLDSNVDKINFILTCKILFKSRDSLLLFNQLKPTHRLKFKKINQWLTLKSFEQIYIKSFSNRIISDYYQPNEEEEEVGDEEEEEDSGYNNNKNTIKDIDITDFIYDMDEVLQADSIPPTATSLRLPSWYHNEPIPINSISESVTKLTITDSYEFPFTANTLPPKLKILKHQITCQLQPNAIPNTLSKLTLGAAMECPVRLEYLPHNLKSLTIYCDNPFTEDVRLPETLTSLSLIGLFAQKLTPGFLPKSLKHLSIGQKYRFPLEEGLLPDSLTSLRLDLLQSWQLEPVKLPKAIERLTMYKLPMVPTILFNRNSFFQLPNTLKYLCTGYIGIGLVVKHIPLSVEHLKITGFSDQPLKKNIQFPSSIVRLELECWPQPLNSDSLPSGLLSLKVGFHYTLPVESLPPTLKSLKFGTNFSQPLDHLNLPSLELLSLGAGFTQPLSTLTVRQLTIKHYRPTYISMNLSGFLENNRNSTVVLGSKSYPPFTKIQYVNPNYLLLLSEDIQGGFVKNQTKPIYSLLSILGKSSYSGI